MSEKKGDYVAVPTEDVSADTPAQPPTTAHPSTGCCQGKRSKCKLRKCGRLFKIVLIGSAIGYFVTHSIGRFVQVQSRSTSITSQNDNPVLYPGFLLPPEKPHFSELDHSPELVRFMKDLERQFGERSRHSQPQFANTVYEEIPPHGRHGPQAHNGRYAHHGQHGHRGHHGKGKPTQDESINVLQDPAPAPPTSPHDICVPSALNSSLFSSFPISAEQYQKAAFYLGHGFPGSNTVVVSKSMHSGSDITVDVNVYYGDESLKDDIALSAFDHKGEFVVEVKRTWASRGHRNHGPFTLERCLLVGIDIKFPAELEAFGDLKVKSADAAVSGSLPGVLFDSFQAGVGNGNIKLTDIAAKQIALGVLRGSISGTYTPTEKLISGVIHGSIDETVTPNNVPVSITASAVNGPVAVSIPSEEYQGEFVIRSARGGSPTVQAPNPADIHVEKYDSHVKAGYYKTKDTGAKVVVRARHGNTLLSFI